MAISQPASKVTFPIQGTHTKSPHDIQTPQMTVLPRQAYLLNAAALLEAVTVQIGQVGLMLASANEEQHLKAIVDLSVIARHVANEIKTTSANQGVVGHA